jgi:hypothetical protein
VVVRKCQLLGLGKIEDFGIIVVVVCVRVKESGREWLLNFQ